MRRGVGWGAAVDGHSLATSRQNIGHISAAKSLRLRRPSRASQLAPDPCMLATGGCSVSVVRRSELLLDVLLFLSLAAFVTNIVISVASLG